MSAHVELRIRLSCDGCAEQSFVSHYGGPVFGADAAVAAAEREAREEGWRRAADTFLCPKCAAKPERRTGRAAS